MYQNMALGPGDVSIKYAPEKAAKEMGEIEQELKKLERQIQELTAIIKSLETRLTPALAIEPPSKDSPNQVDNLRSPLARGIRTINLAAEVAISHLRSIHERVCL